MISEVPRSCAQYQSRHTNFEVSDDKKPLVKDLDLSCFKKLGIYTGVIH
jgi:hypothetical protein